MRVLFVHNRYLRAGGEDSVAEMEADLLGRHGHHVERWFSSNAPELESSLIAKARVAIGTTWSATAHRLARGIMEVFRPDVVHCHNTFPLPGPSVYYAARELRIPVVQTLHNYRLMCVNGKLFRNGSICRTCSGHSPIAGVWHACYRGSRLGSAAIASMILVHRLLRTWASRVDRYVALTRFSREQFIGGGLPPARVAVKPNFVATDPCRGEHKGEYALFVGRLDEEKGVHVALRAWAVLRGSLPLRIAGDGPLRPAVVAAAASDSSIAYEGQCDALRIAQLMRDATFLIVPSLWDEHCPLSVLEALATGLPVIVSDHGALREIVGSGDVGWRFSPGDPVSLAETVRGAMRDTSALAAKVDAARKEYLDRYSAQRGYDEIMHIYDGVLRERVETNRTHAAAAL